MTTQIERLSLLIAQLRHTPHGAQSAAKKWMQAHVTDDSLKELIPQISVVAYHLLDALLHHGEMPGSTIATELGVTRGAVTRAARTLKQLALITSTKHPDNQKNIYYQLTASGKQLAMLHNTMREELYQQLANHIQATYSPDQIELIIRFLTDIKDSSL
ncbi:MarR family winged helix-turn-helix transcriptional regulator [Ligilactobacillus sp. LYQ60]|uniref:MarR family winged helix-turn-helix transcriptional regulator n=1 Tax=unclassified Ligilactobacillus TaxID=2767920 RepID=UPI0038547EB5